MGAWGACARQGSHATHAKRRNGALELHHNEEVHAEFLAPYPPLQLPEEFLPDLGVVNHPLRQVVRPVDLLPLVVKLVYRRIRCNADIYIYIYIRDEREKRCPESDRVSSVRDQPRRSYKRSLSSGDELETIELPAQLK